MAEKVERWGSEYNQYAVFDTKEEAEEYDKKEFLIDFLEKELVILSQARHGYSYYEISSAIVNNPNMVRYFQHLDVGV